MKRYREIYFDLDTYRILELLERPQSDRAFRWTI